MIKNQEIKWVESSSLDTNKWDALVSASSEVSIYCLSWYLDSVADHWGALVVGDYEVVMPLPYTIKKGQSIIYQPFFSRQIGVFSTTEVNDEVIARIVGAIPDKFRLIDFGFSKVVSNFTQTEQVVFQQLDLAPAYQELFGNFSSNAKRQIKKALKNEVEVNEISDYNALIDLFKQTKGEEIGLTNDNFLHLKKLLSKGLEQKMAILLGAYKNKELIAIAYYFVENHRVTYLKGAGNAQGREFGGMYLIMNTVIERFSNTKRIFDFGGSKIESIAEFYKKFGAVDHPYYLVSSNKLPWVLKKAKALRDKLKK